MKNKQFLPNKSMLIANPGCYVTATNLLLAPLVKVQISQTNSIIVDAKSVLSGAGKGLSQSSTSISDEGRNQKNPYKQLLLIQEMLMLVWVIKAIKMF